MYTAYCGAEQRVFAAECFGRTRKLAVGVLHLIAAAWCSNAQGYRADLLWPEFSEYRYFTDVFGVACDSSDNVYVLNYMPSHVVKLSKTGDFLLEWGGENLPGPSSLAFSTAIACGTDDRVYVADSGNDRIAVFDSSGNFLREVGGTGQGQGNLRWPTGVAADASGNVYVADSGNNRVQKFSAGGTYVTEWGALGSAGGQFNEPRAIAIDRDSFVYVADYRNSRIQKFTSTGLFVGQWGNYGYGNSNFVGPKSLHIDSQDIVYVLDEFALRRFTTAGAFVGNLPGGLTYYQQNGITTNGQGEVYLGGFGCLGSAGNGERPFFRNESLASRWLSVCVFRYEFF